MSILSLIIFSRFLFAFASTSEQYEIYHRLLPRVSDGTPRSFIPLGSISLLEQGTQSIEKRPWPDTPETTSEDDGTGWYQVGLQLGDSEDAWLFTSTRSCYLTTPPTIQVHLDGLRPVSISVQSSDIFVDCAGNTNVKLPSDISIVDFVTAVPEITLLPPLGPPPVVDSTTGAPITPPPEKTFLQKYWMYIVGLALFFAVQMGPDEPRGRGQNNGR
ncbi:uncharacterized protein L203_100233 [Cryptococcus depauperatus CBS 7841]|uniref:Uncharacterized protein n=1 Tax=Cryptococcus depauperatus CBS 7841 TaxID=1295531 RepID=A0A1E3IZC0_9TREE|nr:hypothetical protein L203_00107 [Cryptococcus depauperatus CBS 7841]